MVNERLHYLKAGAIKETRKLLGIATYLWVLLSLFSLHKALILNEGNLLYQQGFAVINALALAKVILVGEHFHLGEDSRNRPLIYPILFRSIIFAVLLVCFHIIEETLIGELHGRALSQSIPDIASGKLLRILMIGIIMFVVLIPFFAFRELEGAIGPEELRSLLFGDKNRVVAGPPLRRRRWETAMVAAAALAALGGGWVLWSLRRGTTANYVAQRLERDTFAHGVRVSGIVSHAAGVPINARLPGVIAAIDCSTGTKVKAGEICAKIDPRPYQIIADKAKSDVKETEARLARDKADLAQATRTFEHQQALAARRSISSKAFDKSRKTYEETQARAKLDEAKLADLRMALRGAEAILSDTDIAVSADGTVVSRNVEIGQRVGGPDAQPLFLITTDPRLIQVTAKVGEKDVSEIKPGDKASFTIDFLPNQVFAGQVIEISLFEDAASDMATYRVVINAPNPQLLLKPGMAAAITILVDRHDNDLPAPN